jgi:hypothetical protein
MDFRDLLSSMKSYYLLIKDFYKSSGFSYYVDLYQKPTVIVKLPLLSVLGRFREKRCSLLQDRIFSVLSLCLRSSRVTVDYDQDPVLLACNVLANSPDPLCLCEVKTLLRDLDLLVDPATEILNVADPRYQAWADMYIDVDLDGVQLPRTLPWRSLDSSGGRLIGNHTMCPMLEEVIVTCARRVLDFPPIPDRELTNHIPAQNIPFIFRQMDQELSLDLAQKLNHPDNSVFTIETASPELCRYTLRIHMHSIVNTRADMRSHCLTTERDATQCYQGSKPLTYKRMGDAFPKQYLIHFHLTSRMSFEDCYAVYENLYERKELPRNWGFPHNEEIFGRFLVDLSKHLRGEATTTSTGWLGLLIEMKWPPRSYGYGPCTFVYPRDSTEEQNECASPCAQ